MGATGAKNFENDDAADWAYDLAESNGTSLLAEAFGVVEKMDFADAPDCCIALAAAEVVAAAKGKPRVTCRMKSEHGWKTRKTLMALRSWTNERLRSPKKFKPKAN